MNQRKYAQGTGKDRGMSPSQHRLYITMAAGQHGWLLHTCKNELWGQEVKLPEASSFKNQLQVSLALFPLLTFSSLPHWLVNSLEIRDHVVFISIPTSFRTPFTI